VRVPSQEKIVEARAVLASNLDGVFKAGSGDQSYARAFTLQQRIGADGGAVQQDGFPPCGAIRATTPAIACEGSEGVEKTFKMRSFEPSSHTQSVNVPPLSMAILRSGRDEGAGRDIIIMIMRGGQRFPAVFTDSVDLKGVAGGVVEEMPQPPPHGLHQSGCRWSSSFRK